MGEARGERPMVDTHCHLDSLDFVNDVDEVLDRARTAGVKWFVTIGSGRGTESAPDALALAHSHPDVVACVGIHPLDASCGTDGVMESLAQLAQDKRVVGIGETGLDFRHAYARRDQQADAFRRHVQLARALKKPIIVHSRAAAHVTLSILKDENARDVGGVFHSFSEDYAVARAALDMGFDLSFSALALIEDAQRLLEVAKAVPRDRMMVESNAPVLAPPEHRGDRCEPAYLELITHGLAEWMDVPEAELRAWTFENAVRRFKLDALE
jgi:TatD DNase family protein